MVKSKSIDFKDSNKYKIQQVNTLEEIEFIKRQNQDNIRDK